jgi:hypothetical protein
MVATFAAQIAAAEARVDALGLDLVIQRPGRAAQD